MKDFWSWLVTSSADPARYGLAFKGFMVGVVPFVTLLSPVLCQVVKFCFDIALVNPAIDAVANLIVAGLTLVSSAMIVWGLGRKVSFGRWSAY